MVFQLRQQVVVLVLVYPVVQPLVVEDLVVEKVMKMQVEQEQVILLP